MRIRVGVVVIALLSAGHLAHSQSYTSLADGAWTTAANWNNTGGYGTSTPPLTGYSSGTITLNNNMTISGNYVFPGGTLNIAAGKTLTITGNLSTSNGSTINVSGTLNISGDVTLSAPLNILPGGKVVVNGNVTVMNSNYLNVGTNAAATPYADLVIQKNLIYQGGTVTVNKDGRVAIYGNVSDNTSGGTSFVVNSGGQVYVNGNFGFVGGGDHITNNNTATPYGLYVNGTTTSTGGGSTLPAHEGNKSSLMSTDPAFYSWIIAQPNSPLPISLLFFKISKLSDRSISLIWSTATELNFDYFSIERSSDGENFYATAEVQGHGTTNIQHDYSWTDNEPMTGTSYYRLRSVDINGASEIFSMVAADLSNKKNITVYPVPVNAGGTITAEVNFNADHPVAVSVTNINGNVVARYTMSGSSFTLPVEIPTGIYIYQFSVDEYSQLVRVSVE